MAYLENPDLSRGYVPGRYYHCPYHLANGAAGAPAQRLHAVPIQITRPVTVTKLGIFVSVVCSVANSNARLGIYSNNNGVPGSLIVDGGEVDVSVGTGAKEVTISTSLAPAWYWLAVNFEDVTSLTILTHATSSFVNGDFGVTAPDAGVSCVRVVSAYGALPAAFPAVVNADFVSTSSPRVWWRMGV